MSARQSHCRFSKWVGPFIGNVRGAAAVEFALVAPVFFALIVSMLELGLLTLKSTLVDRAVSQAAVFVYTGATSSTQSEKDRIRDFICKRALLIRECAKNLSVELTRVNSFSAPPTSDAPCRDSSDVTLAPVVTYQPGAGNDIVYMRVCATTNVLTPGMGLGLALAKTKTNRYQIISSIAFMNEPF
ncbi:MAG: TadE/TadG family type IV pilus assembly protein [Pseudomonadota bacterium]